MDPLEPFRNAAHRILTKVLREKEIILEPVLDEAPEGLGDLAFPCFPLARTMRMAPVKIAEELADLSRKMMEDSELTLICRIEAVNGYLNFFFNETELIKSTLEHIQELCKAYGSGKDREVHIILEHTSANPNGPFHVGRARNPIIGDTLARILRFAGFEVSTEYYVNDMGKQAVTLAWGVEHLAEKKEWMNAGREKEKVKVHIPESRSDESRNEIDPLRSNNDLKADHQLVIFYQQASSMMETDDSVLSSINSMLERYEHGDREIGDSVQNYCSLVLDGMKETLGKMNVTIDNYVFESAFVYNGDVTRVIEKLTTSPYSMEEDGAHYLELNSFGVHGRDTRFFYTRKEGTSLYTTRDLAYHMDKFRRGDRMINILGEDHKLQSQQLSIALGELGVDRRPEPVFYSFVSLPEGKMSTRRGRVVYLDDLVDEAIERAFREVEEKRPDLSMDEKLRIASLVGIGAVRYNIIRVQMEKSMVFSWQDALNFEGDSAPFVQYTHARACSILRKSGGTMDASPLSLDWKFSDPNELALIRQLSRFPGIVQECANGLKIHIMASFLRELGQLFNQFYRECPVLSTKEEERRARLLLVDCFRIVISNGLDLLGIEAPEYM